MKTTFFTLCLLFSFFGKAQTTDVIYIPSENTAIASLKYNFTPVGLYLGGYITTNFPAPYIYTTPSSFLNRAGISFVGDESRYGIMVGAFLERYVNRVNAKPDIWFKFYPLRTIFKTPKGFDLVLAANYQTKVSYGIGISIPFAGIY